MSGRRKLEVSILDKSYTILSDELEEAPKIADYVDKKIREAVEKGHATNPEKAAVLAALNIAESLFKTRRELNALKENIENRAMALTRAMPDN